jgi:hypothetical protein
MARPGFIALLVGASLALLVLLQLFANAGLHETSSRFDFHPVKETRAGTDDDNVFLLGVGKADITG